MVCAVAATADPIKTPIEIRLLIGFTSSLLLLYDCKIGEIREAVCLGPKACLSGLLERLILSVEQALSVEKHREQAILEDNAKCVPPSAWNFVLDAIRARREVFRRDRQANAAFHLV